MKTLVILLLTALFYNPNLSYAKTRFPANDGEIVPVGENELNNASIKLSAKGKTFCSGFLENSRRVITAAHCFDNLAKANITIEEIEIANNSGSKEVHPLKIFVHKEYQRGASIGVHDVAVILLDEPISIKHKFKVVKSDVIPTANDKYVLSAYGWNPDENSKNFSAGVLRIEKVKIDVVDEQQRLVGTNTKGQLSCSADSGGPLFLVKDRQVYLVGVVSGTVNENLDAFQKDFVKNLPKPETMSESARVEAMRKLCNFSGKNFWTGIAANQKFLSHPESEGLEVSQSTPKGNSDSSKTGSAK